MLRTARAPAEAAKPRRRQWHRVYFMLALFDVLVVALGLTLNHRLLAVYKDSVSENGVWEQRLDRYLDLGEVAGEVNAPGNNVFDTRDVDGERQRRDKALADFNQRMEALESDLNSVEPVHAQTLKADLHAVDAAMNQMLDEADQIFGFFEDGNAEVAATRMAAMDRSYHVVNGELATLREDVGAIQRGLFEAQSDRAAAIQRWEFLIAGFVLIMISAAMLYGHKIKRELDRGAEELNRHVDELETAQVELSEARDELDHRVQERTAQLAAANDSLSRENLERVSALESLNRAHSRLQSQARQLAESNRDLQDFAYVASHDLQEPLRKILAFSDRLETRCGSDLDETGRDYLARMQNASTRMQTLINDLLVFSRVQTGGDTYQTADLQEIVSAVLSDLDVAVEQSGATVVIGDLPVIEADPSQMRQLLQNLIGNALKFRRAGVPAEVRVSAEIVDGSDPRSSEPVCVLTVADNGIGFDPEYAEKVFTVFQRLHGRGEYEGSGVGLAVARRVAERHSGSIRAEGRPGEGATFVVTLPVAQPRLGDERDDETTHDKEGMDVRDQRSDALVG